MNYKHTQIGWVIIVLCVPATVITWVAQAPLFIILILLASTLLFCSLTVTVDDQNLSISFGPGLIRKKFSLKDIESCEVSKFRCCSWGIHGWKKTWLYNVSGFGSIELKMKDGAINYIGSDEPALLAKAVNVKLGRS